MFLDKMIKIKIIFQIIGIVISGIIFDISQNGSFQKSNTYKYLNNIGAIDYAKIGLKETKNFLKKTSDWLQKNIPVYYYQTCSQLKPYTDHFYDLSLDLINKTINHSHNLIMFIKKNYPGFQDSVSIVMVDTISVLKESLLIISDNLQKCMHSTVQYVNQLYNNKNLE